MIIAALVVLSVSAYILARVSYNLDNPRHYKLTKQKLNKALTENKQLLALSLREETVTFFNFSVRSSECIEALRHAITHLL